MSLDSQLRLSYYRQIAALNEQHGVYLVQHTVSRRVFVMKSLSTYDIGVLSRLMDEPVDGVPRIHELIEQNGFLTVIEQYADGEALSSILERRGTLSESEALPIAKQLAVILHRLHSMVPPVIHRDIKPSNIIIADDGKLTLIDLDAAKSYKPGETRDTELMGTAGYAAPEQYGFGASGPETDIYAVGVLLSVMLTGKLPGEGSIGGKLGRVVDGCTALIPGKRYASAKELLFALNAVGGARISIRAVGGEKYRPLGFRSLTPWKMVLASLCYAFILAVCLCVSVPGYQGVSEWIAKLYLFAVIVILILFPSNFCGVLDLLGITSMRRIWLRIALIAVFEIMILFVLLIPTMFSI